MSPRLEGSRGNSRLSRIDRDSRFRSSASSIVSSWITRGFLRSDADSSRSSSLAERRLRPLSESFEAKVRQLTRPVFHVSKVIVHAKTSSVNVRSAYTSPCPVHARVYIEGLTQSGLGSPGDHLLRQDPARAASVATPDFPAGKPVPPRDSGNSEFHRFRMGTPLSPTPWLRRSKFACWAGSARFPPDSLRSGRRPSASRRPR